MFKRTFGATRCTIRVGTVRVCTVRVGTIRVGSIRVGTIRVGTVRVSNLKGHLVLQGAPLGWALFFFYLLPFFA